MENKKRVVILPDRFNPRPSYSLNFTADSRWLIVSVAKDVVAGGHLIYETGSWKKHDFRQTELSPGLPVLFSNNNYLATITGPNEAQISDVETGELVTRLKNPNARLNIPVATLGDDTKLAMISGPKTDEIVMWDLAAIKSSLKDLGLNWEINLPESQRAGNARSIELTIDDGGLSQRSKMQKITARIERARKFAKSAQFTEALAILDPIDELADAPPYLLNELAWLLAVRPDCDFPQASSACQLSETSVKAAPSESSYWNTLGVCRYRNHQYERAIVALEKSESFVPSAYSVGNAYFLAMSHWHLGNFTEARKWLDIATQSHDKLSQPDNELQLFRIEAELLIRRE